MTVTYNGSSITTDTLYEDGTIQVNPGFPKVKENTGVLTVSSLQNMKKKDVILKLINPTVAACGVVSINEIKNVLKKQVIFTPELEKENTHCQLSIIGISSVKKRVAIVTP